MEGIRALACALLIPVTLSYARPEAIETDSYDVLLHSRSVAEQRAALTAILQAPDAYVSRIRQNLLDYPTLLSSDWTAANRAVHVAALVRDTSFAPILLQLLKDSTVMEECEYACPVKFALTIYSAFASWKPTSPVDTVAMMPLRHAIRYASEIRLDSQPLDSVVQGPAVERNRKNIEGKSEEQLIAMAEALPSEGVPVWLVAAALETSVASSKNRIELYVLLMNEPEDDASREFRGAVYHAIYRAERAKLHSL